MKVFMRNFPSKHRVRTFGGVVAGLCLMILAILGSAPPAQAEGRPQIPDDAICRAVTKYVEKMGNLPPQLLTALALTESGRGLKQPDGTRKFTPWPWTINANGKGYFLKSKKAAMAKVRSLQAQGIRSIDVGCMQVNLKYHGKAFNNLEEAFDPVLNATYAGEYLTSLFNNYRNWMNAVERYHSGTPKYYLKYRAKVFDNWMSERGRVDRAHDTIRLTRLEALRAKQLQVVARRRAQAREELANNG